MSATVTGVPTVCTGRQLHSFFYDGDSPREMEILQQQLREQMPTFLNEAKRHQIVCFFAILTGQQTKAAEVLEEFGMVRTFDAHNYKYPDSSKTLMMYTKDMNTWEIQEPKKVEKEVNPFHVNPAPAPTPRLETTPLTIGNLTQGAQLLEVINSSTHRDEHHQRFGLTYLRTRMEGSIVRRSLDRIQTDDLEMWPVGRWVEIPAELNQMPSCLRDYQVEVELDGYRGMTARRGPHWNWNYRGAARIIRARRVN